MAGWNLEPAYSELVDDFGSLDAVFALQGVSEADCGRVLDEPFEQAQLNQYLAGMLSDQQQRAAWSRNGLAFAETADLYSMPQHAADVILAEQH